MLKDLFGFELRDVEKERKEELEKKVQELEKALERVAWYVSLLDLVDTTDQPRKQRDAALCLLKAEVKDYLPEGL